MVKVRRFCVQAFRREEGRLQPAAPRQFRDETEARRAGEGERRRAHGVMVLQVDGDLELDLWRKPKVIERWGEVLEE